MVKAKFKKGQYYIGDLCYAIADNCWGPFCDSMDRRPKDNKYNYNGIEFWWHRTAYGDGTYPGNNGTLYEVDAGLIGIIPIELIEDKNMDNRYVLSYLKNFEEDFEVWYSNGIFHFGNLVIDTNDSII